ncbi:unnamed protein product [Bathycoccus prasinos]
MTTTTTKRAAAGVVARVVQRAMVTCTTTAPRPSSSSSSLWYSTTTLKVPPREASTEFQSSSSSRSATTPKGNRKIKGEHLDCAVVDAMSAREMVFFRPRCSEQDATTSYSNSNTREQQKGRIAMPFAVAGAAIPSLHDKNISREIVNNVNVHVVEDALRRLEIAFPPASTSTEENFEDEENNNGMWCKTHLTYQPSNLVRKRRHGFLARKRTVGGRRVLVRRKAKKRRKMSA